MKFFAVPPARGLRACAALPLFLLLPALSVLALDEDYDPQGPVWEMLYNAPDLAPGLDADGDGFTNMEEAEAGTDPLNGASFPFLRHLTDAEDTEVRWQALAGKWYTVSMKLSLDDPDWETVATGIMGGGDWMAVGTGAPGEAVAFYQLSIGDEDSDEDGVTDWEELTLGWNPNNERTARRSADDAAQLDVALTAPSVLSVAVYDADCYERWPDPAVLVVRRSGGGIAPLTVNIQISGTADRDVDYTLPVTGNTVNFAPGQREFFLKVMPIQDEDDAEPTETVVLTLLEGDGYTLAVPPAVITDGVEIVNQTDTSGPSPEEAARFLIQASFGPNQDSIDDPDQIPENVEEVMAMGFEAWIDDQLERPVGPLTPSLEWQITHGDTHDIYNDYKKNAWWGRAMELRKLRPDATPLQEQDPDPLRQRMAFALSQIFVISERMEAIGVNARGMTDYYDMLLQHSFGNYRDLLEDVTYHASMGLYLSYLGNRKSDGTVFPDENYAREVMQLFSIGLWQLDEDGSRELDLLDQPIPTYDNTDITQFARVFTGLGFPDGWDDGAAYSDNHTNPMVAYDQYHDLDPKYLLGTWTPDRNGAQSGSTDADIGIALDVLYNHQNVGPFIGRLLIQRFVTSNPSPEYIERVTAKFNDNGSGVRGDLGAVLKAILLDPEAREPQYLELPGHGKMREPFLKVANYLRAFNAYGSVADFYYLDNFEELIAQDPLNSPSVFNFYLPTYTPPGALPEAGLVAPEFQLLNATTAAKGLNYFYNRSTAGLNPQGTNSPQSVTRLNLDQEKLMNTSNYEPGDPATIYPPEPLLRRLDLALTGGTLEPETFQIIVEALARFNTGSAWTWQEARLNTAIYLVLSSPEMAIVR